MSETNPISDYTLKFINETGRSIFLTGKAGTGKTTLLKKIVETTHKNYIVVAPTGIAALNAKGVTIHSFFQLPFGSFIPDTQAEINFSEYVKFENRNTLRRHFKMNNNKRALIRNLELLIIDEVSMMRADVLDAMDFMLQYIRKNTQPFGGVQVLFIGDLQQLPPVVRNEEWDVLKRYYNSPYFFHSHVLSNNPVLYVELDKIYRQSDAVFIEILNNLRNNIITKENLEVINKYVDPKFNSQDHEGFITVTTHNRKADAINLEAIQSLKGKSYFYNVSTVGDFPEKLYPLEAKLELKVGAQVMFIKNDLSAEKLYFNGKMAVVTRLTSDEIFVRFPGEDKEIEVERFEWENIKYTLNENTKEVTEEVLGTFTHFPIKLAWAITIHKSQGLTFDKAALDVSQVFLPGQAYVALSRLRSMSGLVLLSPLQMNGISTDDQIVAYAKNKTPLEVLEQNLILETQKFMQTELAAFFNLTVLSSAWKSHLETYRKEDMASPKGKLQPFVKKQFMMVDGLVDASRKFGSQLQKILSQVPVDAAFLEARTQAAYAYFFPFLDQMVSNLLYEIVLLRKQKKAKAVFEELTEIEEILVKKALDLMKAKKMVSVYIQGEELSKRNLALPEAGEYKINKMVSIAEKIRANSAMLIEDDEDLSFYTEKKKTKEPKKPTHEITYEMWLQKYSVKDIAEHRKLTAQTIMGHLGKLVLLEKIKITEIIAKNKVKQLEKLFQEYPDHSLTELKELVGSSFTWEEITFYKSVQKK